MRSEGGREKGKGEEGHARGSDVKLDYPDNPKHGGFIVMSEFAVLTMMCVNG